MVASDVQASNAQDASAVSVSALVQATHAQSEQSRLIQEQKDLKLLLVRIDSEEANSKAAAAKQLAADIASAESAHSVAVAAVESHYLSVLSKLGSDRRKVTDSFDRLNAVENAVSRISAQLRATPMPIKPCRQRIDSITAIGLTPSVAISGSVLQIMDKVKEADTLVPSIESRLSVVRQQAFTSWRKFLGDAVTGWVTFCPFARMRDLQKFKMDWEKACHLVNKACAMRAYCIAQAEATFRTGEAAAVAERDQRLRDAKRDRDDAICAARKQEATLVSAATARATDQRREHGKRTAKWQGDIAALDQSVASLCALAQALGLVRSASVLSDLAMQSMTANAAISGFCLGQVPVSFDRTELPLPSGLKLVRVSVVHPIAHSGAVWLRAPDAAGGRKALCDLVLQVTASLGPTNVKLLLCDPVRLGDSFTLLAPLRHSSSRPPFDTIITRGDEIEDTLKELERHIVHVTQNYLSQGFATLREYNLAAGDVTEPYRILAFADIPSHLSQRSVAALATIVQNGPRCGVLPLFQYNPEIPVPQGLVLDPLWANGVKIEFDGRWFLAAPYLGGSRIPFEISSCTQDKARALVEECVKHVKASGGSAVPISSFMQTAHLEPSEWWKGDNGDGIELLLGRSGVRGTQKMILGAAGTVHHALIVGTIGSGKSNLLHAMITTTAARYSPDQVEFVLVDFKQGTEFRVYKDHMIPHIRVLAVAGEREFGLSALRDSSAEMARRADLFKQVGVTNLREYRRQGGIMPRRLVLLDEYQVLFETEDGISDEAKDLIRKIVREGRAFGVHLLMASQTLSGTSALKDDIKGNIEARVALSLKAEDSREVFASDNTAAASINRPGQGIYNDRKGESAHNQMFQSPLMTEKDQGDILDQIAKLGPTRDAIVFDGATDLAIEDNPRFKSAQSGKVPGKVPVAWPGQPVAIAPPTELLFQRQPERNLLLVDRNVDRGGDVLGALLVSLLSQAPLHPMRIQLIDGSPADSTLAPWLESFDHGDPRFCRCSRADASVIIEDVFDLLERLIAGEQPQGSFFLFIAGASRVRDFRGDEGMDSPAANYLARILAEGPDFGIHTVLLTDSINAVAAFLKRKLGLFGMRLFASTTGDETSFLGEGRTYRHIPEGRYVYFDAESSGECPILRPYSLPKIETLEVVARTACAISPI